MLSFVLAKVTVIYAYIYYASYALPRLPLSGLSKGLTCDVNMQLECSGKQVKQEVLNNISLTTNKKRCPHCRLSLSRDAKKLVHCHCRYHRHYLHLVLFLDQKWQFIHCQ